MSRTAPLDREATLEDLYAVEGKAELVDGRIVRMSPTGFLPNRAAGRIYIRLASHEARLGGGYAFTDNMAFVVERPHLRTFSPDVSWWAGIPVRSDFARGVPALAVEVRSKSDVGPAADRRIAAKRAEYFAAGTQVVWDVDVLEEGIIRVYRADDPANPTLFRRGEVADAEPAVPGWTFPVDELFE